MKTVEEKKKCIYEYLNYVCKYSYKELLIPLVKDTQGREFFFDTKTETFTPLEHHKEKGVLPLSLNDLTEEQITQFYNDLPGVILELAQGENEEIAEMLQEMINIYEGEE